MKRTLKNSRRSREAGYLLPAIGVAAACLLSFVLAEIPAWWGSRGLVKKDATGQPVEASDFAAANQGQLKNVAIAAYEEFLSHIPAGLGGLGPVTPPPNPSQPESPANRASPAWRIRHMLAQWVVLNPDGTIQRVAGKRVLAPGATAQKDFAAITQGQMKAVAAPFYARLAELYWSYNRGTPSTAQIDPAWAKPWTDAPDDDNHHAMANLGQLKRTFSLDLASDADSDGLTNLAELLANKVRSSSDPLKWTDLGNAYSSGGVLTDGDQVGMGLDPTNPVNGQPPDAPTGLHITFRDATVHPLDPDLSKINVEWSAPARSDVTVALSSTYAGATGDWVPVPFSGYKSEDITAPFSKRIYQYRVTFTGTNLLTASTDIAYELPVIRGIMLRKKATAFTFRGPTLFADEATTVPRKFRTFIYDWSLDSSTDYEDSSGETTHYSGEILQSHVLENNKHSAHNWSSGTTTYSRIPSLVDLTYEEQLDLDLTAPLPASPSGSVVATPYWRSVDFTGGFGNTATTKHNYDLTLTLAPYQVLDTGRNPVLPVPYSSLAGSYSLYDQDNLGYSVGTLFDTYDDRGAIGLSADPSNLEPVVSGIFKRRLGDAPEEVYPYTNDPGWMVSPGTDGFAVMPGNFSFVTGAGFGGGAPFSYPLFQDESEIHKTIGATTWTRSWTTDGTVPFGESSGSDSWSETVALSDEVSTSQMVAAAAGSVASFDDVGISWYRPYANLAKYRFTNDALNGSETWSWNAFLDWDYTADYTPAATGASLVGEGYPVDGYVTVAPNISGLVGQYTLNAGETSGALLSSEYKFRFYPPAESTTIAWLETFAPDESEADQAPQYKLHTYAVPAGQSVMPDSALLTVDRTQGWSNLVTAVAAAPGAAAPQPSPTPVPRGMVSLSADTRLKLRVDRNYNQNIDPGEDYRLSRFPKGLIVDVNNIPVSGGSTVFKNSDNTLTFGEKDSNGAFHRTQRVERMKVNLPPNGKMADVKLHIRNPDSPVPGVAFPNDFAEGNGPPGRIRIFTDALTPVEALAPGASTYSLTENERMLAAQPAGRDFWIEGTEPGEVIIDLEYTPPGGGPMLPVERVRIEVNVSSPPKDPAKSMESLETQSRNRVFAVKTYPRVTGIAAQFSASTEPLLTWHTKPRDVLLASMWIGIDTGTFSSTFPPDPQKPNQKVTANSLAWAQGGLHARWSTNEQTQQGAKPYAEVAVDWARYSANKKQNRDFYRILGALQYKPSASDRKWWNMPFCVMYCKGETDGHDQIRVRSNGYGTKTQPDVPEDLVVVENPAIGLRLNAHPFINAKTEFETTSSVTRVPGVPDRPARFGAIEISTEATAATYNPATTKYDPVNFNLIHLDNSNLKVVAVANNGLEVERPLEFSHYRIQLEINTDYDVLIWDKYKWIAPDNGPPGHIPKAPGQASNQGHLW